MDPHLLATLYPHGWLSADGFEDGLAAVRAPGWASALHALDAPSGSVFDRMLTATDPTEKRATVSADRRRRLAFVLGAQGLAVPTPELLQREARRDSALWGCLLAAQAGERDVWQEAEAIEAVHAALLSSPDPDLSGVEAELAQTGLGWDSPVLGGTLAEATMALGVAAVSQDGGWPQAHPLEPMDPALRFRQLRHLWERWDLASSRDSALAGLWREAAEAACEVHGVNRSESASATAALAVVADLLRRMRPGWGGERHRQATALARHPSLFVRAVVWKTVARDLSWTSPPDDRPDLDRQDTWATVWKTLEVACSASGHTRAGTDLLAITEAEAGPCPEDLEARVPVSVLQHWQARQMVHNPGSDRLKGWARRLKATSRRSGARPYAQVLQEALESTHIWPASFDAQGWSWMRLEAGLEEGRATPRRRPRL